MWSLLSRDIGKEINKDLAPVINEMFAFLKENRVVIAQRISGAIRGMVKALKTAAQIAYKFRTALMAIGALGFLALLGKIAIGVKALGTALLLTGNSGLIAWLKILWPLILIGAAAAALFLIIEDIWLTFTDPDADTATKVLLKQLGVWESIEKAIQAVKDAYKSYIDLSVGIGRALFPTTGTEKKGEEKGFMRNFHEKMQGVDNAIFEFIGMPDLKRNPATAGMGAPGSFGASAPQGYTNHYNVTINAQPGANGRQMGNEFMSVMRTSNNNTSQMGY